MSFPYRSRIHVGIWLFTRSKGHNGVNALSFSTSQNKYEKALSERTKRTTSLQEKQWTLESIKGKYDRKEINLFPNYQRGFKWKSPEASRLILTVLEGRFVPSVVVHQKEDGTYDVVDGKQRLSSLLSFYYGSETKERGLPDAATRLQGLGEDDEELDGLTFELLAEPRKRKFNDYSLDVKIIPEQTDDNTVFAVYEDINSGGLKLSPHQLRRAAFYGPYIELIDKLVEENKDFRAILGTEPDESNDGEMILRAFAVCQRSKDFKPPWKRFLNKELIFFREMKTLEQKQQYLEERKSEFEFAMRLANNVFLKNAFRKYDPKSGEWSKKVDMVLWSSLYHALVSGRKVAKWTERSLMQNADNLEKAFILAYKNPSFISLFSSSRVSMKTLHERHRILEMILEKAGTGGIITNEDISGHGFCNQGPRSFPRESAHELHDKQDGKCAICAQKIDKDRLDDGNYAQIDHKIPYSKGGTTTMDNAQLVHAKCNQSKGARL